MSLNILKKLTILNLVNSYLKTVNLHLIQFFLTLIKAIWIRYSFNLNHYLFLIILWLLRKSE